jgi:Tfp pilus assembly protein PilE
MQKGISLIVLVITIIVIIILAGAVIVSLVNSNSILQATQATFKDNLFEYNNEISLFISNEYIKNSGSLNLSSINATNLTGTYDGGKTIQQIITSMNNVDAQKFQIEFGKLIYSGSNENEKVWAREMGVSTGFVKGGLVLWYDFSCETNSGTQRNIAKDLSNSGNNGSLAGFEYTNLSGYENRGLNFDAVNDVITLPSIIDLQTTWSIEVFCKLYDSTKTFQFFVGSEDSGAYGKILLNYNKYIAFRSSNGVYNSFNILSSEVNGTDSVLTFVSNGQTIKLYINGVLRSTITPSSTYCRINCIGNAWSDRVWLAKLNLYNIRVYNREITNEEVVQNYDFEKSRVRL